MKIVYPQSEPWSAQCPLNPATQTEVAKLLALGLHPTDPVRERILQTKNTLVKCPLDKDTLNTRHTAKGTISQLAVVLALALNVMFTPGLNAGGEAKTQGAAADRGESSGQTITFTKEFQTAVEKLRGKLEEWGVLTASVPVVMSAQDQFKIDKNPGDFPTAKEYINSQQANVAGSSFQSTETAVTDQVSATVKKEVQLNGTTGKAEPTLGPAADVDTSKASVPPLNITNFFANPAAPGALAGQLAKTTGIPGRAAVLLGVNDKLTERILATMASPPFETFLNKDYGVYFAIVQISCNPGWRTRENYIADLTAECEYYDTAHERTMPESRHEYPRVFSVLPLLDAQNLELGNSERQLRALAAQLTAAYPTIGLSILGQNLISFVHRYQKDSITRTPVTVTNSYSTGRTFGFRLAPSFTAQADPAYRKSRAANILNPTAFPVLVTVVTKPSIFIPVDESESYDSVRVNIGTRWLIKDRPPLPVWYKRLYTPLRRNTLSMRTNWATDVSVLTQFVEEIDSNGGIADDPVLATLRSDAVELIDKCGPQETVVQVRPSGNPQLSVALPANDAQPPWSPSFAPKNDAFSMVITGNDLNRATKILIGGKSASSILPLNPLSVMATFPAGPILNDGKKTQLVIVGDVGAPIIRDVLLAKSDQVKEVKEKSEADKEAEKKAAEEKETRTASITLDRDANGNLLAVKVDRSKLQSLGDKEIADMMIRVLEEKNTTSANRGTVPPASTAPQPSEK